MIWSMSQSICTYYKLYSKESLIGFSTVRKRQRKMPHRYKIFIPLLANTTKLSVTHWSHLVSKSTQIIFSHQLITIRHFLLLHKLSLVPMHYSPNITNFMYCCHPPLPAIGVSPIVPLFLLCSEFQWRFSGASV